MARRWLVAAERCGFGVRMSEQVGLVGPVAVFCPEAGDSIDAAILASPPRRQRWLDAEGGSLSVEATSRRLGVSAARLVELTAARQVLGLPLPGGVAMYPSWQFVGAEALNGLAEVLAEFVAPGPWFQLAWFLGPNSYLDGRRPIDVLRAGDVTATRRAARAFGGATETEPSRTLAEGATR